MQDIKQKKNLIIVTTVQHISGMIKMPASTLQFNIIYIQNYTIRKDIEPWDCLGRNLKWKLGNLHLLMKIIRCCDRKLKISF